jgi:nicotinate-nucleotide adenylyltransferase
MQTQQGIGILGGTFNPVHFGHLLMASEAYYRFSLGRVVFVPASRNPLKDSEPEGTTAAQRQAMLGLACDPDARFSVDAYDLRHPPPSYMIDTARRISRLNPEAKLYLILGADSALSLPLWRNVAELLRLCCVVVCDRQGRATFRDGLPPELSGLDLKWEYMPMPGIDISASELRLRARMGKPLRYLTPDPVAMYIREHRLYA